MDIAEAVRRSHSAACYDCGKCTATCPVSRAGADYSPRKQVLAANLADRETILAGGIFSCLTCRQCDERCPTGVEYTDLVRDLRAFAFGEHVRPECPHGGALQSAMRIMAAGKTDQKRLGWLEGESDLATVPDTGDVFLFTGCTMYYDAFFPDFGVKTLEGTKSAVRLLNRLGVTPVVSPEERCCGHDLLWNGDVASFEKLARHNAALIEKSGAATVVAPCAECARTLKMDTAPFFSGSAPTVVHLTEYLASRKAELTFRENGTQRVTFQDPCRLGRHMGVYDPPRDLLRSVPGVEFAEMAHSGSSATCCAGGSWTHCDRFAKRIQVGRLREAKAAGAEVMVTACPKCQVHLRCAMKDPNLNAAIEIEMRDVGEILAAALARDEG